MQFDQLIVLAIEHSQKGYPERLRRVRLFDAESQRLFVYLTNNFILPTLAIAMLYKSCWQVGLSFNWMKQRLRIKSFCGNANQEAAIVSGAHLPSPMQNSLTGQGKNRDDSSDYEI